MTAGLFAEGDPGVNKTGFDFVRRAFSGYDARPFDNPVDVYGVPNTFAQSTNYGDLATKAKWLSKQLDVPLDDQTY